MDTSTTAGHSLRPEQETFNYEDWEDLKELFAKAAEQYESALSLVEVDRLSQNSLKMTKLRRRFLSFVVLFMNVTDSFWCMKIRLLSS
jgi:hypothetical protein